MSSKTTRWFLYILIAFGFITWAATGSAVFLRLGYIGIALVAGAWLLSSVISKGILVTRATRVTRASVGDYFEERFQVEVKTWPGCPWVEVINQSSLPGAAGSRLITYLGRSEKRVYIGRTLLIQRGQYPLGPTLIFAGDPFGLFPVETIKKAQETLVVLPKTYPIVNFPLPPGLLPGGKTIHLRTADVTPNAAGVREYVPGDPMKRIHWPTTARRDRFMVKEFEQDPQAEIWLFVDGQRKGHFHKDETEHPRSDERLLFGKPVIHLPCDTFEYAMSITGSLAQYYLRNRRAVGLACSSARFTVLPSEHGDRQLGKIMETLAFLQPDGFIPPLGLIAMQAKLLPLGSGVVLITPNSQPDLLVAIEELQRRNLYPILVLIDEGTFHGGENRKEGVGETLRMMNVPVFSIGYQEDIPAVFSKAGTSQWKKWF